ncbi:MAG: type I methionyl aminopeptidase [Candidatus Kapabacteria bacterium]|nr:type I methionyl aminopeptidase [Candidatus Kapabacteria bacterium]
MTINNSDELESMMRVGGLVAQTLDIMQNAIERGITTAEVNALGESFARSHGARSAPQLTYDFPAFTCISINDEIVHGIPGSRRIAAGDVVKLDVTLELDGFMADSARTICVEPVSAHARRLTTAVHKALNAAITGAVAGRRLRAVGHDIEKQAHRHAVWVVKELAGHGIGRSLHEEPSVPNWPDPETTVTLHEGLVLAVEPMFSLMKSGLIEDDDGWTLRMERGCFAAHMEHTIVIQQGQPLILTQSHSHRGEHS